MTAARAGDGWTPSDRELERRELRARLHRRGVLSATAATVLFLLVVLGTLLLSPGWPTVRDYFFSWSQAREALPAIWHGFWRYNVTMFLLAEPIILVVALSLALVRQSRSPVMVPIRVLATVYTDLFRGVPTLVLVYLFVFGMPALGLVGVPTSAYFWALMALVVSYSAYVAEVFRSGIESIHPSQLASADALGLSRAQAMRHVVVPQAVRRVLPPLLNDFVSLQKDTSLVASVSIFDAVFAANDYSSYHFNYSALVLAALFFICLTIPLARLTDRMQKRALEKERAGAL